MRINNLEHIEAHQKEVNERNEKFIASLSPEEKQKFEAVSQAMQILTENNVQALVFPILSSVNDTTGAYQYNNFSSFMQYDDAGKPNPEKVKESSNNIDSIISSFCHFVLPCPKDRKEYEISLMYTIFSALGRNAKQNENLY